MSDQHTYVACPEGCGALITKQYKKRFGRCKTCYHREHTPLGKRIARKL